MTNTQKDTMRSTDILIVDDEISNLKGFTAAGYGAWRWERGNHVIADKIVLGMEREKLLPLTGRMLSIQPENNETLSFVVDEPY